MVWRGVIFAMLMTEGCKFYYVNECLMYLEVKSGPSSPPCWSQTVLAGLLSIPSFCISGMASTECVECKQASSQSPPPLPARVQPSTHSAVSQVLQSMYAEKLVVTQITGV